MNLLNGLRRFWTFLKQDTWQSWLVSLGLAFLFIKFVFFPVMSLIFMTPLPLVVVESCSMYHSTDYDAWWDSNGVWYATRDIQKQDFEEFPFRNGLNKGDIVLVSGRGGYELGDVIIFNSEFRFPLIHRIVETAPRLGTKGDNGETNPGQLPQEKDLNEEDVLGKAIAKVPGLGWVKLIFFEASRPAEQRGFC